MIVRGRRPNQTYTVIANEPINSGQLSFRALGVLVHILSKPDDWRTSSAHLARRGKEGRDAIRKAITELEAAGYITRHRCQDRTGRWSSQLVVHEMAVPAEYRTSTDDGKPGVGFPGAISNY